MAMALATKVNRAFEEEKDGEQRDRKKTEVKGRGERSVEMKGGAAWMRSKAPYLNTDH